MTLLMLLLSSSFCLHGSCISGSWSMPTTHYSSFLSYSFNVLEICNTVHSVHMTLNSIQFITNLRICISGLYNLYTDDCRHILLLSVQGEGSSSVALLKVFSYFFLWKFVFSFLGSFSWSNVRSKVRDVVCVRILKPSEFVICDFGLYKINWIEFKWIENKASVYC